MHAWSQSRLAGWLLGSWLALLPEGLVPSRCTTRVIIVRGQTQEKIHSPVLVVSCTTWIILVPAMSYREHGKAAQLNTCLSCQLFFLMGASIQLQQDCTITVRHIHETLREVAKRPNQARTPLIHSSSWAMSCSNEPLNSPHTSFHKRN
jgi:hypothetical protein